jgi:prophage antirepressor-like protein
MEEITDPNCIVRAFETQHVTILKDETKCYFRGTDVAKVLEIANISSSIQNFTDKEKGLRKVETLGGPQNIIFLSSHGVYRLLYSSKKKVAEQFREWVGDILDDIIFNQGKQLQKQLEDTQKELENKTKVIEHQETLIKELENKPDTEGFKPRPGYIYLVRDTSKIGHYKIGYATDIEKRLSGLNTASSTYTLETAARFKTTDKEFAEKVIHHALFPLKIKNRKEWFYIKNEFELAYTINTIKDGINYVKRYNFAGFNELKEQYKDLNIQEELKELTLDDELKEKRKIEIKQKLKKNAQNFTNKTGEYKGAFWCTEKEKWRSELKLDGVSKFLGYHDSEIDAAKAYLKNEYNV